ncbi:calponin homology domain-containing protein [Suillus ampliporus]|nr:calponin homology domain-containing protein [Suillus ampliporus]
MGIGYSVVNIGSSDIAEAWEHVDIKIHPELYRLCEEDETIEDLLRLTLDQILLLNNFGRDVSDGENHTVILNSINAPLHLSKPKISNNAHNKSSNAEAIGCRKYLTPSSLVSGNPRLKLAFVANLFNTWPGLEHLDEQGAKDYRVIEDFNAEVFNLFENLGWTRHPSSIRKYLAWVYKEQEQEDIDVTPNQSTLSCFKQVENTNYAVELGKRNRMHLVGIQGADTVDTHKILILGLSWQLMRLNITKILKALSKIRKHISDTDILQFKDPAITTGLFFLDLLDAMRPCIVDPALVLNVSDSRACQDRRQDAKLVISMARRMTALTFLISENIVDVHSRLILMFAGSLMSISQ